MEVGELGSWECKQNEHGLLDAFTVMVSSVRSSGKVNRGGRKKDSSANPGRFCRVWAEARGRREKVLGERLRIFATPLP